MFEEKKKLRNNTSRQPKKILIVESKASFICLMPHLGKLKKMKVTPVMINIAKGLHLLFLSIDASGIEPILN